MSTIGKNAKNRRKKNSPSDRQLAIDFNGNLQFMHQMSGGETEFDLQDLTLPTGAGAFTNPTPETIRGINLSNVRKRIKLFNGEGKSLGPAGLEWEVLGTKIILKNITAGVDEVFFGQIENIPRQNISFFDGVNHKTTGFLTPGETEFNVGFAIPLGDIDTSNDRIGPVRVHRQREIQYLNTDFTTADVSADGDYALIDNGTGESSLIEFNTPGAVLPGGLPEFISVERTDISVDKEDGSLRQEMDVLGGAVERAIDELSIIQSKPKSDFLNFNPTRQQLKQFGDEVLALALKSVLTNFEFQAARSIIGAQNNGAYTTDPIGGAFATDFGSGLLAANGNNIQVLKDSVFLMTTYHASNGSAGKASLRLVHELAGGGSDVVAENFVESGTVLGCSINWQYLLNKNDELNYQSFGPISNPTMHILAFRIDEKLLKNI